MASDWIVSLKCAAPAAKSGQFLSKALPRQPSVILTAFTASCELSFGVGPLADQKLEVFGPPLTQLAPWGGERWRFSAAPPYSSGARDTVLMRIADYFLDQRVVLREQEVTARPERKACAVVDRQGKNFRLSAHEATRQRREQRSWSFMIGRVLRHR